MTDTAGIPIVDVTCIISHEAQSARSRERLAHPEMPELPSNVRVTFAAPVPPVLLAYMAACNTSPTRVYLNRPVVKQVRVARDYGAPSYPVVEWEDYLADHPFTEGKVIEFISAQMAEYQRLRDSIPADAQDQAQARWEQMQADAKAQADAEDAAKARAKAYWEAEKQAWVEAHGSDHLKAGFAAGYDMPRTYREERALLELGRDYALVTEYQEFKDREDPSPEALAETVRLSNLGYQAGVMWVEEDDRGLSYEAVVVSDYLGRYDMVKIVR